jgi:8-amino-7-oxononanoate synthase
MPLNEPLAWINDELDALAAKGLDRQLRPLGAGQPGRVVHECRTLVNFASNDYLGLAADPRLAAAAAEAAATFGWGAGASPLVSGWREPHAKLAADLATFEDVEAVALFPSGFAANLGTIAAIVGKGDVVYLDRLNHACLVDGARLSGATLRVYPHLDAERLARILARDSGRFRRILIATDGVFSMDGDLAPLASLADLTDEFGAMLLVDEAHGTGLLGPNGRGAAEFLGVSDRVAIKVGTLSKAFGSVGGFVAGSRRLVDWLVNRARPLIYSTGLPPAGAAAASEALRISICEPWRRARALDLADRFRTAMAARRVDVGASRSAIVPVLIGDERETLALAGRLNDRGMLVGAIRPPTVPRGTARLRLGFCASHTEDDLDALLGALGVV